jgi:hypothetical protein
VPDFSKKSSKSIMTTSKFIKKYRLTPSEYFVFDESIKKFKFFKNYPGNLDFTLFLANLHRTVQLGAKVHLKLIQDRREKFLHQIKGKLIKLNQEVER